MHNGENAFDFSGVLTKKDFGRVLTALREKAGLTVRELARQVGAPSGTISCWCTGRHLPTLSQQDLLLRLLGACGVTEQKHVEAWLACWRRLRRPLGQRVDMAVPYRGLESFQEEDAGWFFGRSRLTEALVHRVTSGPPGLVIVVGASGSGKSSLLRAGLLPSLCGSAREPGDRWQGVVLSPGKRPLTALAAQLALVADVAEQTIEDELRDRPAAAAHRIARLLAEPLLLVVDQFEEVFTVAAGDPADQGAFLDALGALAAARNAAVRVVAGLRADFYPDALRWPLLATALQDNQIAVAAMTEDELRQAIVEPARRAGAEIDSALVDVLLRDLAPAGALRGETAAGVLPLLSHVLLATWEQGQEHTIHLADYLATGGVHGAIAQTADTIYTDLSEPDQALVRKLFLRLVHVGDNTPDTRRRVRLDELTGGLADGLDERTADVLGRYVDRRLITADVDGVEISHEALLHSWPRLRDWIDTGRSGHRLHRRLTEAAKSWQDAERDPGALYRGMSLAAAAEWVTEQGHRDRLNRLEQDFIDAGVEAERAERLRERRRTRLMRRLAAALGVLALLSASAAVYSIEQRARAGHQRDLAISRQVAGTADRLADSDPVLAAQLAVAAYRIAPTLEATSSVLGAAGRPAGTRMVRPGGARQAVAVDPAGTVLAAAGAKDFDTEVLLWDLREPSRPALLDARLSGHTKAIYAVAFSPDGRTLVTGSADRTVRLWDVADPAHPRTLGTPLTAAQDRVLAVAFTADGSTLAVGGADLTFRLWDVRDRERPAPLGPALTGSEGAVQGIAFAPDGRVVAIADAAGAVRLWDLGDRTAPRPLGAPLTTSSRVNTVAFSADGKMLAAGSNDSAVRLWSMEDPAAPRPAGRLTGATGWVNAISFSANGKLLAAADAGARVHLWDVATQRMRLDLPHAAPATAVAFRDDDRVLYTNSADGVARRWLVPGPALPADDRQITGLTFHPNRPLLIDSSSDLRLWDLANRDHPTAVSPPLTAPPDFNRMSGSVAVAADGRVLAAPTRSGNTILFWDLSDPAHARPQPGRLTGHTALIENVEFSHRGRLLSSASDDGTVRLWDATDAESPQSLATLNPGIGFVFATAFSPDDTTLAAVTQGGYAVVWDIRDPSRPVQIGAPLKVGADDARSLAFSPDGRTLAVGIANGTIQLWNLEKPEAPTAVAPPTTGPDGIIHALAFNHDGSILAAGAGAGQTWMWRSTELDNLVPLAILKDSASTTWVLKFSPDGSVLAAANGDVHLWHTDPQHAVRRICESTGDRITEAEWAKYIPDTPYQSICS